MCTVIYHYAGASAYGSAGCSWGLLSPLPLPNPPLPKPPLSPGPLGGLYYLPPSAYSIS